MHSHASFCQPKKIGLLALLALTLTACNQNFVNNLDLNVRQQNGDILAGVQTEIELGQTQFPFIDIPIVDRDTGRPYGTVSLKRGVNGENYLGVEANISQIANLPTTVDPVLPNGQSLPIVGLQDPVALDVGNNSTVYLGFGQQRAVLGVAIAIQEFDSIGTEIQGGQLFLSLNPQNAGNVTGVFGIFTGQRSGESGLALFVDIPLDGFQQNSLQSFSLASSSALPEPRYTLRDNMSAQKQRRLGYRLWKLRNKRMRLTVD